MIRWRFARHRAACALMLAGLAPLVAGGCIGSTSADAAESAPSPAPTVLTSPPDGSTTTSPRALPTPPANPAGSTSAPINAVELVETSTTSTVPEAAIPPLPAVGHGDGEGTVLVQQRLLELGFWHAGVDGEYGLTTTQAVMAFQKYSGLEPTGDVDASTAAMLTASTQRAAALADTGDLVEIDKKRQLLFVVRNGITIWTLNTSTGNGLPYEQPDENTPGEVIRGIALTPDGLWKVNRERAEGWWEGDLGEIYRPKYFRGGIAVHGSNNIPNYPASHGCVRVSVPAMDFIWSENLMPMKSAVWVHGEPSTEG